jgi:glycolate oxidase FAD binding subunit
VSDALSRKLAAIVGTEHVAIGAPAAVDGVAPRFLARPGDVEQVSRLLACAHAEGLSVVPRGAGTALGLGNPPARVDLMLDLTRLNRVVEYEPADVSVSVEAGMTLDELEQILGKHRQFLPLDPPGRRARTVGGVLATDASGPLRFRYGTGRDVLLGVRFVQADGAITWGGSKVVKSVTGYDIPKLLTGSLGTLGVIVETTLRLHPVPDADRSWAFGFASIDAAQGFVAAILDSTLQPSRVEILNAGALAALGQPAAAGVAVSVASVEEAVRAQGETLARLAARTGGSARPLGDDFWEAYGPAIVRTASPGVRLRIACLATSVAAIIARVEALAREAGASARVAGCAGVGALTAVLEGAGIDWQARVLEPLRRRLAGEGGSVIVEQCPRALKEAIDVWGPVDPQAFALMKRIKAEFDPKSVLNPGRFVGRL